MNPDDIARLAEAAWSWTFRDASCYWAQPSAEARRVVHSTAKRWIGPLESVDASREDVAN
jgi:hypothetical protein